MNGKPVIVVVNASNPMIFKEFEPNVDGILMGFGVQHQAILDVAVWESRTEWVVTDSNAREHGDRGVTTGRCAP